MARRGFFQDSFSPTQLNDTYTFSYVTGIPIWTKLAPTGPTAVREPAAFTSLVQTASEALAEDNA